MRNSLFATFILSASIVLSTATAAEKVVRVLMDKGDVHPVLGVSAGDFEGYRSEVNTVDCLPFDSEQFRGAFRFEVELALVCNVLHERGLADKLQFLPYPNTRRSAIDLTNGRADMIAESIFQSALPVEVLTTDPIIEAGDFQVGVFTTPDRSDVLGIKSSDDLRRLRGITVEHWVIDLKTLRGMGLHSVITTSVASLIPNMITANRADFMLSYLDKSETSHLGERLVRLNGFRVSLDGVRVLAISPDRPDIAEAMNKFIRKNRTSDVDRVREAYKLSGFIVDKYSAWTDVTKP